MKQFKFTIGRRIRIGFGILIFLTFVAFILTQITLTNSRKKTQKVKEISASIGALGEARGMIDRSKKYISTWRNVQNSNDPDKEELRKLIKEKYPLSKKTLNNLAKQWEDEKEKELLVKIFQSTDSLFDECKSVMEQLNSFEAYEDINIKMQADYSGDKIENKSKYINATFSKLIGMKHESATRVTNEMFESFDLLKIVVNSMGFILVIVGIIIASLTVRTIVKPVHQLQRTLVSMGKGVLPTEKIKNTNDEIGEMAVALDGLVEGLRGTTEFAKEIGAGNFQSLYKPLSEQDSLGLALLKMRSELAEHEKILEEKVIERTLEVVKQKEELEKQRDALAKLSIVASKTDNGIVIANTDGSIEYMNEGFVKMLGLTLEQLKAKNKATVYDISYSQELPLIIKETLKTKKSKLYETLNYLPNGNEIWIQTTLTPVMDEQDNVKKLVFIDTDITKRKYAEEQIKRQHDEIQNKSVQLQQAYTDITDSINYASRLQQAILPLDSEIKEAVADSFVLFSPRDVVSGDFYWAHSIESNDSNAKNKIDKFLIAAVDCTGHGVPGAFMSMAGYTLLNEIINDKRETKPGRILTQLHRETRIALRQGIMGNNDGMDIAFCTLDIAKQELQFSGAMRPLYIFRNISTENSEENYLLEEVKGEKFPIGGAQGNERRLYNNHIIKINKGDTFYLTTDGFADQFGGERGKKLTTKKFKELLLSIQGYSMPEQKIILAETFEQWKGKLDQVDDILVIGIRM